MNMSKVLSKRVSKPPVRYRPGYALEKNVNFKIPSAKSRGRAAAKPVGGAEGNKGKTHRKLQNSPKISMSENDNESEYESECE